MTPTALSNQPNRVDRKTVAAALAVVLIWSTTFSFASDAIREVGPWEFRFYSTLAGLVVLLPFLRRSMVDVRQMDPKPRRQMLWAVTVNGTLVAGINILALAYFPATTVLTLMYTMPAFVALMEATRERRLTRNAILAPAAALSGVVLYVGGAGLGAGGILIMFNALLWAWGTQLSGRFAHGCRPSTMVTVQVMIAFLSSIPLLALPPVDGVPFAALPGSREVAGILYAGVLNGPVVFGLWYYAIQGLGAERASRVTLWVPVIGALSAVILFGEVLGGAQVAGIALVVLGMALRSGIMSPGAKRGGGSVAPS
ncbi:DMT family transporter [Stenotrophomonas sp. ISL-67]|uniref:DMT family transporter n=1 Tax=Stenotrophomonas sp. ISL-67 TaxID=2819171 RepID=UPI001BED3393|nr:DMT family transporter [Stenotrophomonas sp. ISL-67]MBT2766491.1 DMT family transporter [Stenotrophomonas sp. ISL-67]